jgi:hypothetical protein
LNTQFNESLHSLKAKLAEKNYNWKISWLARCPIAGLNWNKGHSWKLEMHKDLGVSPLSSRRLYFLKKEAEDQKTRKKHRATALNKAMTLRHRRIYKESIRARDKGAAQNKEIVHV